MPLVKTLISAYRTYSFSIAEYQNHQKFSSLKEHSFLISVFLGQEFRIYCLGLTNCYKSLSLTVFIWRYEWGRLCFQVHSGFCRIYFLMTVWLRTQVFCWLLARNYLQVLRFTHTSLVCGLLQHVHSFPPDLKGSLSFQLAKTESYITKHNHKSDILLPHILLVGSKSYIVPIFKGERFHKGMDFRRGKPLRVILGSIWHTEFSKHFATLYKKSFNGL